MESSSADILQFMQQMQQQNLVAMQQLVKDFSDRLSLNNNSAGNTGSADTLNCRELVSASISGRIDTFRYLPEEDETFDVWYNRYGTILEEDGNSLDEAARVRLLVGKLGASEFRKYSDTMLPRGPYADTYGNILAHLRNIFAPTKTLFTKRYDCFQTKQELGQALHDFYATVNAKCEKAQMPIDSDTMKCLIFICGLRPEFAEIRSKCLQFLEKETAAGNTVKLEGLMAECNKFLSLKENLSS